MVFVTSHLLQLVTYTWRQDILGLQLGFKKTSLHRKNKPHLSMICDIANSLILQNNCVFIGYVIRMEHNLKTCLDYVTFRP